jgi:dienelactone hydrolase
MVGAGGGTFGAGGSSTFGAGGGTFGVGGSGTAGAPGTGGTGTGGDSATGGSAGAVVFPPGTGGCGQGLPPIDDYGAMGPFPTTTVANTGPDGNYTVIRPTTLGANGFKHPPTMWGNGITTTPAAYVGLLGTIASNGFVVVASNSTNVTPQLMTAGLDWLVAQNTAPGDFQGKLDPKCLVSIGYSLGGGAAVNAGSHANVVTTVSFHGLTGNSAALHGPLLLFTSKQDTFVSAAQFVDPTFKASTVQTFYATLVGAGDAGHLTPINTAGPERAPAVAWLRLWVYGDQAARKYFDGTDCILCKDPWTNPQTKNWH